MSDKPDFSIERKKILEGVNLPAGVDEVGRGPWAGPVVAAAVILDPEHLPHGATDSKKLSGKKREELNQFILKHAIVSIAEASVEEIDQLNIREATFLAMTRAVEGLEQKPDYAFVDGNVIPPKLQTPAEWVIKGDARVMSIAAASIVAKQYRDKMMAGLAKVYPYYAWERNAGYGTKAHQEGLAEFGVTPHHRKSFKPIKERLEAVI